MYQNETPFRFTGLCVFKPIFSPEPATKECNNLLNCYPFSMLFVWVIPLKENPVSSCTLRHLVHIALSLRMIANVICSNYFQVLTLRHGTRYISQAAEFMDDKSPTFHVGIMWNINHMIASKADQIQFHILFYSHMYSFFFIMVWSLWNKS